MDQEVPTTRCEQQCFGCETRRQLKSFLFNLKMGRIIEQVKSLKLEGLGNQNGLLCRQRNNKIAKQE